MTCCARDLEAHFQARAQTYDEAPWVHDRRPLLPIGHLVRRIRPRTVVDVGSGSGAVPGFLLQDGFTGRLVAIDQSIAMLGARSHDTPGVVGDAARLPLTSDSVDLLVLRQVLHYLPDVVAALREASRVTRREGGLLVAQIVPFDEYGDADWWREVVSTRQPLRRNALTSGDIAGALDAAGFAMQSVCRVVARSSLGNWLDRYPIDAERKARVEALFWNAPVAIRQLRRFSHSNHDLTYSICWALMHASPVPTTRET